MTILTDTINSIIPILNSNLLYVGIFIFVIFLIVNLAVSSFKIVKLSLFAVPTSFILSRIANLVATQNIQTSATELKNLFGYIQEKGLPPESVILLVTFGLVVFSKSKLLGIIFLILAVVLGILKSVMQVNNPTDILISIAIGIISIIFAKFLMMLLHIE